MYRVARGSPPLACPARPRSLRSCSAVPPRSESSTTLHFSVLLPISEGDSTATEAADPSSPPTVTFRRIYSFPLPEAPPPSYRIAAPHLQTAALAALSLAAAVGALAWRQQRGRARDDRQPAVTAQRGQRRRRGADAGGWLDEAWGRGNAEEERQRVVRQEAAAAELLRRSAWSAAESVSEPPPSEEAAAPPREEPQEVVSALSPELRAAMEVAVLRARLRARPRPPPNTDET